MENKENSDGNNQIIQDELNEALAQLEEATIKLETVESNNQRLRAENLNLIETEYQLREQLDKQKKRIDEIEAYGKLIERLVNNFKESIDFIKIPNGFGEKNSIERTPKSTTTPATALTSASASLSAERTSPVNIVLTQTQTLHLQQPPNRSVHLVDHG